VALIRRRPRVFSGRDRRNLESHRPRLSWIDEVHAYVFARFSVMTPARPALSPRRVQLYVKGLVGVPMVRPSGVCGSTRCSNDRCVASGPRRATQTTPTCTGQSIRFVFSEPDLLLQPVTTVCWCEGRECRFKVRRADRRGMATRSFRQAKRARVIKTVTARAGIPAVDEVGSA
jgi:hypothetical protein